MDKLLLKPKYQEGLLLAIDRLSKNNKWLNEQVLSQLVAYKNTRREVTSKIQQRLYYKSIETIKHNLFTDISIKLLNYRMCQFARWFSYMWNNPSLCKKTAKRLQTLYPYKTTHFLRQWSLR